MRGQVQGRMGSEDNRNRQGLPLLFGLPVQKLNLLPPAVIQSNVRLVDETVAEDSQVHLPGNRVSADGDPGGDVRGVVCVVVGEDGKPADVYIIACEDHFTHRPVHHPPRGNALRFAARDGFEQLFLLDPQGPCNPPALGHDIAHHREIGTHNVLED